MFCPKCGNQNPETGKFCRGCGTDLGNVSSALAGVPPAKLVDKKGKQGCEGAIPQIFMGIAFMAVAIILGATGKGSGWWFWMLIPAFGMLGSGVAKCVQRKQSQKNRDMAFAQFEDAKLSGNNQQPGLPASHTSYVGSVESRYKTGDLVPPSVTDNTTRHLEINKEGETMALPKK